MRGYPLKVVVDVHRKAFKKKRAALGVARVPLSAWHQQVDKIEHRMFCRIAQNGRGRALLSRQVVVNRIGQTTTAQGLRIQARLDTGR